MLSAYPPQSGGVGANAPEGTRFGDELHGLGGRDALAGGTGVDTLRGGGGDRLPGGDGGDTFVHRTGDGRDRIVDFRPGDVLTLAGYSGEGRALAFAEPDGNSEGVLDGADAAA